MKPTLGKIKGMGVKGLNVKGMGVTGINKGQGMGLKDGSQRGWKMGGQGKNKTNVCRKIVGK